MKSLPTPAYGVPGHLDIQGNEMKFRVREECNIIGNSHEGYYEWKLYYPQVKYWWWPFYICCSPISFDSLEKAWQAINCELEMISLRTKHHLKDGE